MEEREAIKEAQRMARDVFEIPSEKHSKEAGKPEGTTSAGAQARTCNSKASGPMEGPLARWLTRSAVQG